MAELDNEAVLLLAQASKALHDQNIETLKVLQSAPGKLAKSVELSLSKLEEQRQEFERQQQDLARERQAFEGQRRSLLGSAWVAILGGAVLCTFAFYLAVEFYFWPIIEESKVYAQNHRALETGSVFGAHVIENEAGRFVQFDEGITVLGVCGNSQGEKVLNCVALKD